MRLTALFNIFRRLAPFLAACSLCLAASWAAFQPKQSSYESETELKKTTLQAENNNQNLLQTRDSAKEPLGFAVDRKHVEQESNRQSSNIETTRKEENLLPEITQTPNLYTDLEDSLLVRQLRNKQNRWEAQDLLLRRTILLGSYLESTDSVGSLNAETIVRSKFEEENSDNLYTRFKQNLRYELQERKLSGADNSEVEQVLREEKALRLEAYLTNTES